VNTSLILNNVALYSLQIGLLIGLAAFVPAALRLRLPGARLAYWHVLLAACLLLPLVGPRKQEVLPAGFLPASRSSAASTPAPTPTAPPASRVSQTEIALALLGAGALGRLVWLGAGLLRLRRYRLHSRPLVPAPAWSVEADLRLSEDVASPVTFGLRKPVVLLPAGFHELDPPTQEAILAHECLHVRRHDWTFTLVEELVRVVFWFHPAIWWLLGEIQLAREQAVDRGAVEMTQAREEYVDALLAIAGARAQLDLAPAPLFLRRRHLKQRVVSILKEARMSKTRLVSALAAGLCIMAATCWLVAGAFPLAAAPQTIVDAGGVSVDTGGAALLHRTAVPYPEAARANGIQGMVTVEVALDSGGNVINLGAVSGPEELRRPVLQSVLNWHFARDSAGKTRQVSVLFQLPPGTAGPAAAESRSEEAPAPQVIRGITVAGLPDAVRNELLAGLPLRAGDTAKPEDFDRMSAAIKRFDEHLTVTVSPTPEGADVRITAPGTRAPGVVGGVPGGVLGGILSRAPQAVGPAQEPGATPADNVPQRIRVGGNVQSAKLVQAAKPVYPPLAKQARIQGTVQLNVTISLEGAVTSITVMSGHPLLVQAALDAVRQWVYQPTLLNGQPVEVVTTVEVNFTLADAPLPEQPQQ
jgi:TonB family protein